MHVSDDRTTGDGQVMVIDENASPAARLRPYHVMALLPAVGLLGGVTFANRVEPYVLGLPFLLFWVVLWVVSTSGIMALITALDSRHPEDMEVVHSVPTSSTTSRSTTS
jgi:hypothetical protein